jgi:hypothetical protein
MSLKSTTVDSSLKLPRYLPLFWEMKNLSAEQNKVLEACPKVCVATNILPTETFGNFYSWINALPPFEINCHRLGLFNHDLLVQFDGEKTAYFNLEHPALQDPFPQIPQEIFHAFQIHLRAFIQKMDILGRNLAYAWYRFEIFVMRYPIDGKFVVFKEFHHDSADEEIPEFTYLSLLSDNENEEHGWEGGDLLVKKHELHQRLVLKNLPGKQVCYSYRQNEAIVFNNLECCHTYTAQYAKKERGVRDVMVIMAFPYTPMYENQSCTLF